jgi:hypothetical protein
LYTVRLGELPTILSNKMVELRNDVIHRGVLPDLEDVLRFGAAAYEVIETGIQRLRATCVDDLNAVLSEHVAEISSRMGTTYPRSFQVTPTALNVIEDISHGYRPFAQVLAWYGITAQAMRSR